ncbi:pyruvate carboxyltransferase [Candidatus Roizmanbacteria bacterium CG10_big_fil_rev_8_21_14_0_10_39_6]|uniref:Pyruvate carboxyltransferase n=1 Tax=Candidatus Roizmanbacteria bacterium CG10_big_fil_rev_8_21_14_0_10_39_6 TaxID=1974853 RepID=A0A2M8KT07_9BACT|nr:MAG: pyruvate carboxyltransferase [Candidatus Roizmanbacteria bacterium CG10_big_fil_rev_8_21_14_0_10_39_6]
MRENLDTFKGVIDTTLRDGQQSPLLFDTYTYRFGIEGKMAILDGLVKLGVRNIEFFSPIVSTSEGADFAILKDYIKSKNPDVRLLAHCRTHPKDIEQALTAGFDGLNLYMGMSPQSQNHNHGLGIAEITHRVRDTVEQLRASHPDLYIRFSGEDCFRTSLPDVYKVYDEIADLVDTFGMPDTVGIATPELVRKRIRALKRRYPGVDLECHFHNDRGYSLINAVTAVLNGASYIDTSVWGLAERSGITSVTGLLFNLFQEDPAYCEGYNLELCYPLNAIMGSILNAQVPPTEPVSVTNRTHTAGVHQGAVLKNAAVYEAMDLGRFGVTKNQLLLGPLSGWNLVYYYLREFKGYDLSKEQAQQITTDFKMRAGEIQRNRDPESVLMQVLEHYQLEKLPTEDTTGRIENI